MRQFRLPLLILVLLIVGALLFLYLQQTADAKTRAYGFIDVKESTLAFDIAGRIDKLYVDEGAMVEKGALLATLDTTKLQLQLKAQSAQCARLKAELTKLEGGYRPELKAQAHSEVARLQAAAALANLSAQRAERLYRQHSISTQERDEAHYGALQAKAALDNAQAVATQYEQGYEAGDIAAKRAELAQCKAQQELLDYQITTQSKLFAPISGSIRSRLQELGNQVSAQVPVFYVAPRTPKLARFYVSELVLDKLKVGSAVTIANAAGHQVRATISAIAESAMFTPKTVQTEELRPDLVYEVRAEFADEAGQFRLGQAITVYLDDATFKRT
ncbi:MAG: HlyD family efflux transporter periplasmic adaptor subunit [Candidatus Anaerobiospirillum merdipullorum]|uniref:HlyD family efflux transporter periplasmic adaptor subunit n=1 Tax=Candidatus Anaerobiospirillum merdipullorum TaxID=2838450 RepID=A0A9E2KLQ7_9GAMM|nr:HlyD family efflux transporter periplasmic adaptor subunit [Candidatus Anaerobiospirillum merdipullorum]